MNAIIKRSANSAVIIPESAPRLPHLSPVVAHALTTAIDPVIGRGMAGPDDPGHRLAPVPLQPAEWDEAQRAAEAIDAMLAPVTYPLMFAWLVPVNLACRNPQHADEFSARVTAITEMCGDLPCAAFTIEARRRLDSNGFFPSAHDVRQAVGPAAMDWARKRDALRNLHRAKVETPAERVTESPDERAANAERNRLAIEAMKIQMDERERAARPSGVTRANHLSPAQRIAEYRRLGQHATADAIARANGMEMVEA